MVVLNLLGDFENPWKRDPAEEKRRIAGNAAAHGKLWHPSTVDWQPAFDRYVVVDSFSKFLGCIQRAHPRTIHRINVVSHGGSGLFAFSGEIRRDTGDCMLNEKGALDEAVLTNLEPTFVAAGTTRDSLGQTARQLRDRFATGGMIVFYLCDSGRGGFSSQLLQEVANAFGVTAKGFATPLTWCCQWDLSPKNAPIERGFALLPPEDCTKVIKKRGVAHLEESLVATVPIPGR